MTGKRSQKIVVSMVLVLIITILPTAATLRADNAAKPMMSHDFTDVPVVGQEFMEPFIDAFYHMGITGGCSTSPLMYCPTNPVTRGSMAVFMGRALGYVDMDADLIDARAYFKQTELGFDEHGVVGSSVEGRGVYGISDSGQGIYGKSTTGHGVRGISTSSYGVSGSSDSGVGVFASSANAQAIYATSANSYGVYALSGFNTALYAGASTEGTVDTIYDIVMGGSVGELFGNTLYFFSNNGLIVDLDNDNNAVADTFSIRNGGNTSVFTVDESGNLATIGTIVAAGNSSGSTPGVSGSSTSGYGVSASSFSGSGLYAISGGADIATDAIYDIVLGNALGEISGGLLHLFSDDDFTIDLDNNDNGANDVFSIRNSSNTVVFSVTEAGVMTATGSKSAIVDTVSYGTRAMYAVEATEVWFEDFGTAQLIDGEVVIEIDPMFSQTVNLEEDYHVFFTPIDGSADLYITARTATSFTVRADDASDIEFSYRIVAKRLGYEDVRMEQVVP